METLILGYWKSFEIICFLKTFKLQKKPFQNVFDISKSKNLKYSLNDDQLCSKFGQKHTKIWENVTKQKLAIPKISNFGGNTNGEYNVILDRTSISADTQSTRKHRKFFIFFFFGWCLYQNGSKVN